MAFGASWRRAGSELITTAALIGAMVLIPLLSVKNARLADQLTETTALALESETLRRSIALSPIEGTLLPPVIVDRIRESLPRDTTIDAREFLLVAFMPTVCGICLTDGLESLKKAVHLQRQRRILLHALVGEHGRRDREDVLRFRRGGLLDFPVAFIPSKEMARALFAHMGDQFPQEPLYMRVDNRFRILTAFQANQRKPELLDLWLNSNWAR